MQAIRGLHLVTMPLTPLRFIGVAGGLSLITATYCLAHGLVAKDGVCLPLSLASGVTSTLPWSCAWEGLKRLSAQPGAQRLRPLLVPAILIAALVSCAALEHALSTIYSSNDSASLAEILYRLLPIPLGIGAATLLLLTSPFIRGEQAVSGAEIATDAAPPTERLRRLQTEPVLNVPTRHGVLAVRTCDIEYVRAAGNYVELITHDRTLLMRTTLCDLGGQLRAVGFVRVHRSLLVNALHVVATRRAPRGRRLVQLRCGAELPVGRQFLDNTCTFIPEPPP